MRQVSLRRRVVNRGAAGLIALALLIALVPLVWILAEVIRRGLGAVGGLGFFTMPTPGDPSRRGGGVANGIIGTAIMVGLASAAAVPAGIAGAIYLVEFGGRSRMGRAVRFFADVMTGIPSIVFGIFTYGLVVVATGSFSAFAGAVALGLIIWPVVVRTAEEVLALVPADIKEGALALGIPRWRAVLKVVLPTASAGLVTGSMLGVARAAGETAPLLFTALGNQFISLRLDRPISALPLEIFRGASSPYAASNERAWASAATLIILVLALTLGARALVGRKTAANP